MSRSFKKHSVSKERWDDINYVNRRHRRICAKIIHEFIKEKLDDIVLPKHQYHWLAWRVYIPQPLENQCEWEVNNETNYRWSRYVMCKVTDIEWFRPFGKYCNCYLNKRGYYWRNIIK